MRYIKILQKIFLAFALFGGAFQFAYAGVADNAIKTWNTPAPDSGYQYTDSVVYEGTVQIPAGWVGRVRVCQDVGSSACVNSFVGSASFDNSESGTTTETFSIDTGVWASGVHTARIAFDGFAGCRLVCAPSDTICQADPAKGWCIATTENQVPDQTYPARAVTVGTPPQPVLSISPNPLHFWNHVKGTGVVTQTVTLTNVGSVGTLAAGALLQSSGVAEFSCQSGCNYSIAPGESHTVTIAFAPPPTEDYWQASFGLSCGGCVTTNQTLDVDATTVAVPSDAQITLEWEGIDFGIVDLGSVGEAWAHITNTGGTAMMGTIDLSDSQISCQDSCDFALNPGEDMWKRFYFDPIANGPLTGVIATFRALSGGASSVVTPIYGEGNDKPILNVWSYNTWDNIYDGQVIEIRDINAGGNGSVALDIYNSGSGLLEASLGGLPSGVFTCSSGCGPYVNIAPYDQTWQYVPLRIAITLTDDTEQVLPLVFTDTTPGGSGRVINLTVRVIPNAEPISEMVGGYPCNLNFGNVLAGDSALPRMDPGDNYWYQDECGVRNAGVGSLKVTIPNFSLNGTGRYDCVVGAGLSCGTFFLGPDEEARFTYRFTALAGDPDTGMHHWNPVEYISDFEGLPSSGAIHIHASPMSMSLGMTPESNPAYDFGLANVFTTSDEKSYILYLNRIGGRDDAVRYSPLPGSVAYTVGDTAHFRCIEGCTQTLSFLGDYAARFRVVFEPGSDAGAITETMSIPYAFGEWTNPPVVVPMTLDLAGEGNNQQVLEVSGDLSSLRVVDFGSVNVGTSLTRSITFRNSGLGDLSGAFDALSAPFSCSGSGCDPFVIPSGETRTVDVMFTPSSNISYQQSPVLSTDGVQTKVIAGNVTYRYIRWTVLERKDDFANSIQVAGFEPRLGGGMVSWPGGTSATNPSGNNPGGEESSKAVDGNTGTKWLDFNFNADGGDASHGSSVLVVDTGLGNSVTFDSYRWVTANDATERDPVGWTLEGSNDGSSWTLLDTRSEETITNARNTPTSDYAIILPPPQYTLGGSNTFTLRGVGKFEPVLTVSTNYINFDTLTDPSSQTYVGDVRTATFRITNDGLSAMSGNIFLTAPTSNFLLPSQSFSLDSGDFIDVDVQFSPVRDTVPLSGQVTIQASEGTMGTWSDTKTINLAGIGAFASLTDFRGPPPNFGPVVFGKEKTITLTLKNAGVRPLGQGEFQFPVGSPFTCVSSPLGTSTVTGNCLYDIGPAGSPTGEQSLVVKFVPRGLGAVSVNMLLSSLSDYAIEFTGTGIPPRFNYKEQ